MQQTHKRDKEAVATETQASFTRASTSPFEPSLGLPHLIMISISLISAIINMSITITIVLLLLLVLILLVFLLLFFFFLLLLL